MNARLIAALTLLTLASLPGESCAQRGFRAPVFGPSGGASLRGSYFFPVVLPRSSDLGWVVGIALALGAVWFIAACVAEAAEQPKSPGAPASRVRITAAPPGEAPETVRLAWVGLELPLAGGAEARSVSAAAGVLSGRIEGEGSGYVVEGRAAIDLLAGHAPDAATWWRDHAAHVTAPGYCLVFPHEVCTPLIEPALEPVSRS